MTRKQKKTLIRIIIAAAALVALRLIPESILPAAGVPRLVLYLAVYIVIGYDILRKAALGFANRRLFDENFLMSVATLGAFALAIYTKSGDYTEGIAVMLFYQVGELFQNIAVGKSRRSITALMDIRPDYANVESGGTLGQVDPDEVPVGTLIVVQPGEKVPLDGVVESGSGTLDTVALTGESVPREVSEGDEIVSGCVSMTGVLKIRTTKVFGESTVSKILDLVENASSRKSRSEDFISRFARVYTPAVCFAALALFLLPPLIGLAAGAQANWSVWLYRALTFLVVSCPCALVISIPLTFFAGIGGASREGILVKGSNYLEALSETKYVVFDKTGTLTQGVFEVTEICPSGAFSGNAQALLEYAALAECASSHPISRSLRSAYGKEIDRSRTGDIEEKSGHGVTARVDGRLTAAGNDKLMRSLGIEYKTPDVPGTVIHVAVDNAYAGYIVISDVIKEHSAEAITGLKNAGISKTVMLTGDSEAAASYVASALGIDEYHAELLPADKVTKVEELIAAENGKEKLAFAGDGINDAPVLSRADIGIAMGAMGSDAAIEAADVVLMDDDPLQISKAIRISKKCLGIVKQNIAFALIVKFACLVLCAAGAAGMWLAIFADVGVMVIAVLNAIRALRI